MTKSREEKLWPLLTWRVEYSGGFPLDPSARPAWLMDRLSVEGLPNPTKPWDAAVKLYRKLRSDQRLALCTKFFASRGHMNVYTVLYRHGGMTPAIRQEAPSAGDAAYAVSASVGHKATILAVMHGSADFAEAADVPRVFCFWRNSNLDVHAWRSHQRERTTKIKMLTP
jgi:hypothetical protein